MIEVISFDLDGTVMQSRFGNKVWLEGLPHAYAMEKNIPVEKAYQQLKNAYDRIGKKKREWYDLQYWIDKLGLSITTNELLLRYKDEIQPYPEVEQVIKTLSQYFTLIISSCAMKEFITMELDQAKLQPYFSFLFSSTSDTTTVAKNPAFYQMICSSLQIDPGQIVHVGDSKALDYEAPRKIGMKSVYVNRKNALEDVNKDHVISSLSELIEKIKELS